MIVLCLEVAHFPIFGLVRDKNSVYLTQPPQSQGIPCHFTPGVRCGDVPNAGDSYHTKCRVTVCHQGERS